MLGVIKGALERLRSDDLTQNKGVIDLREFRLIEVAIVAFSKATGLFERVDDVTPHVWRIADIGSCDFTAGLSSVPPRLCQDIGLKYLISSMLACLFSLGLNTA
jgi:hypothetical protein